MWSSKEWEAHNTFTLTQPCAIRPTIQRTKIGTGSRKTMRSQKGPKLNGDLRPWWRRWRRQNGAAGSLAQAASFQPPTPFAFSPVCVQTYPPCRRPAISPPPPRRLALHLAFCAYLSLARSPHQMLRPPTRARSATRPGRQMWPVLRRWAHAYTRTRRGK